MDTELPEIKEYPTERASSSDNVKSFPTGPSHGGEVCLSYETFKKMMDETTQLKVELALLQKKYDELKEKSEQNTVAAEKGQNQHHSRKKIVRFADENLKEEDKSLSCPNSFLQNDKQQTIINIEDQTESSNICVNVIMEVCDNLSRLLVGLNRPDIVLFGVHTLAKVSVHVKKQWRLRKPLEEESLIQTVIKAMNNFYNNYSVVYYGCKYLHNVTEYSYESVDNLIYSDGMDCLKHCFEKNIDNNCQSDGCPKSRTGPSNSRVGFINGLFRRDTHSSSTEEEIAPPVKGFNNLLACETIMRIFVTISTVSKHQKHLMEKKSLSLLLSALKFEDSLSIRIASAMVLTNLLADGKWTALTDFINVEDLINEEMLKWKQLDLFPSTGFKQQHFFSLLRSNNKFCQYFSLFLLVNDIRQLGSLDKTLLSNEECNSVLTKLDISENPKLQSLLLTIYELKEQKEQSNK